MKHTGRTAYERYHLLIRFFVPYVLILVCSLLVGMIAYNKTSSLVESETMNNNLAVLQQTKGILDRRFAEIETIAQQLANDTKVVSFQHVKEPFAGTNPYKILQMEKKLFDYRLTNHFLIDYFMVFKNSGLAVSPRKVYKLEQFYELQFHYEHMRAEDWIDSLLSEYHIRTYVPAQTAVYENKPYSIVSYVQSFGSRAHYGGAVVVLIDNGQIQSLLRKLDTSQGGFAYIADEEGRIISYVSSDHEFVPVHMEHAEGVPYSEKTINGHKMLVTQTISNYNGWSYVSAQPAHVVLQKVHYIKDLSWTILLVTLILGLVLAAFFAYRNSRPLQRLLRVLSGPQPDSELSPWKKPVDYIQQSVTSLIQNNEAMKEKLNEQLPLLRNTLFDRLLKGRFSSNRDLELAMEYLHISWPHRYFVVAILNLNTHAGDINEQMMLEHNLTKLTIHELIMKAYACHMYTQDIDSNKIALLMNRDADSSAACLSEVTAMLKEVHRQLMARFHIQVGVTVGGVYSALTDISRSYEEAEFASNFGKWTTEHPILHHSDIAFQLETYYFPTDMEMRLINLVKSGNFTETQKLLEQIRQNNTERNLSSAMKQMLVSEMAGSLLKCCEQLGMDQDDYIGEVELALKSTEHHHRSEEALDLLSRAFIKICRKIDERKKSHNDRLKNEMLRYIDENYMRSDLSLNMLSSAFQTSEAYVSYFFKEQTGINFSDYVENVRMDNAKKMLADSEMSVKDIAHWVGYYSLNTFSRAFKRFNGVSATEYRRVHQQSEHGNAVL